MAATQQFEGVIREGRGGGAYVEVPFDVEAEYGSTRPAVKATIEGETFRWRIMRMGGPHHVVGVPKAIREKAGKGYGDTIAITLEADLEPREVQVPEELALALEGAGLREAFDALSYTERKKYARDVAGAKHIEARARRIAKVLRALAG